jgi:general secretion pathway protein L
MNRYTRPVEKFLRWWLSELVDMVPARVRRFCSPRTRGWVVAVDGDRAELLRRTPNGEISTARFLLSDANPLPALASRKPRQYTSRVRLRLPTRHILHTYISLPLAAEENLGEVLRFELDRRTPFTANEVHLAHRIEQRDEKGGAMKVALTLVPRAVVGEIVESLTRFGVMPDRLEVQGDNEGDPGEEIALTDRGSISRRLGTPVRIAIAAAFLCSAVAAYASSGRGNDEIDSLSRRIGTLRVQAGKANELRTEISALEEERAAAANASRLRPNELLAELTHLLPDDTWLDRLQLAAGKLTLTGFSDSSSNVIRLLEEQPYFAEPSFAAPVTQDAETGKERFTITAAIRGAQP